MAKLLHYFESTQQINPDGLIEATPAGKPRLISYINSAFDSGEGTTGIYDAIMQSIDRAAQGTTDKKAVIVLSDGVDNNSVTSLDQVIAHANEKKVKVFSIYFIDPDLVQWARPEVMRRLAGETGGQYYDATTIDPPDFASIYQKISNVIEGKYTLTYTSTLSTCAGTISVRADSGDLYGENSTTFP
jgi:hypothetical protein